MTRIDGRRRHASWWAVASAAAAGGVWLALAMATGLIFHLMPAAPPLLGGLVLRRGGQLSTSAVVIVVGSGIILSLAVGTALAGLGQPLDDPIWTVLVLAAGAAAGWWISGWRSGVITEG